MANEAKTDPVAQPAPEQQFLSKLDVLKCGEKLPTKDVILPEGGKVRVRTLHTAQRDEFLKVNSGRTKVICGPTAYLVFLCAVTVEGKPLFETKDLGSLGQMNPNIIDPIFQAAARLNGLIDEAVDDAEKN